MGVISQTWNDPPHLCGGGIKLQIGRKPTSRSCRDSEHPSAFDANYMNAAASQRKKISRYRARSRASASSAPQAIRPRSEEHTSELQSLMRIPYAVFCLKKQNPNKLTATPKRTNTSRHKKHTQA